MLSVIFFAWLAVAAVLAGCFLYGAAKGAREAIGYYRAPVEIRAQKFPELHRFYNERR